MADDVNSLVFSTLLIIHSSSYSAILKTQYNVCPVIFRIYGSNNLFFGRHFPCIFASFFTFLRRFWTFRVVFGPERRYPATRIPTFFQVWYIFISLSSDMSSDLLIRFESLYTQQSTSICTYVCRQIGSEEDCCRCDPYRWNNLVSISVIDMLLNLKIPKLT